MLVVLVTKEFENNYKELPTAIKAKVEKQEQLFRKNPFHPSLHTEKLEPKNRQVWSFRIDKKYRVIFNFIDNNKVVFVNIGHHGWIYNFKF